MEEDLDACQGADLLGLALGQGQGASELDEFVDFEVYFDEALRAAEKGEAVPFLRARLCDTLEILRSDLQRYLWQRDRFVMEVDLGDDLEAEPHLSGHLRTGDGVEDEWVVVDLLRQLTASRSDVSCRITDGDGELLLIEAALAAPRWLNPMNAENRCWLRGGQVHILPRPQAPEPIKITSREALSRLRAAPGTMVAKEKVQRAIKARLEGFPRSALESSRHVARAVLPAWVARLLVAYPQLVSVASDHLPPPPAGDFQRWRRQLTGEEAELRFDCEALPPQERTVCIGVRFTRCQYARLVGLRCDLPQRFGQKRWRTPRGADVEDKAMHLGALLCCGLEAAYLQGSQSATAVLRWPAPALLHALAALPPVLPWWPDAAFAHYATQLQPAIDPESVTARLAFLQQSNLEEPFRRAFLHALRDPALAQVINLEEHWRDRNDEEDWLQISMEELDMELKARQAEFDAYDRRRADADSVKPEQLREELASMGKELSGLLGRASCIDGVDTGADSAACSTRASDTSGATARGPAATKGGDTRSTAREGESDSESEEGSELDILGMEEEAASSDDEDASDHEEGGHAPGAGLRDYMSELDEQLEQELDGDGPLDPTAAGEDGGADGEEGHRREAEGLPLGSHHVKVHHAEALELDVHAMEHVLASYCTEHNLEPGPASLLLKELGLGGPGGLGAPARRSPAAVAPSSSLDSMD